MQSGGLVVGRRRRRRSKATERRTQESKFFLRSSWVGSKIRKNMKGKHEANDTLAVTSGVNACRERLRTRVCETTDALFCCRQTLGAHRPSRTTYKD
jgi:hypothetical protein